MISSLFFDLDDTILDFHRAEACALSGTLRALGLPDTQETVRLYSEINASQWRLLEEGRLCRADLLTRRFRILFDALMTDTDPGTAQHLYEQRLAKGHFFMPHAEEMLRTLAETYRLFLVSNGTRAVQEGRLASAGIAPLFERRFLSEDLGAAKPSPLFFDACFRALPGLAREEVLLIGDSLSSDMRGGADAGLLTCWYNPRHLENHTAVSPSFELDDLADLPGLLRRIQGTV